MKIRNQKLIRQSFSAFLVLLAGLKVSACGNMRTTREISAGATLGTVTVPLVLSAATSNVREERVAYNLVADAVMDYFLNANTLIDVALITTSTVRRDTADPAATYPAGEWTEAMVSKLLPLSNTLVVVTLTGAQLRSSFEHVASRLHETAATTFLIPSHEMKVVYNLSGTAQVRNGAQTAIVTEGTRVTSLKLNGVEISPTGNYRVGTMSFIACATAACQAGAGTLNGGYVGFREAFAASASNVLLSGVAEVEAVKGYIRRYSPVTPVVEGRTTVNP